MSKQDLVSVSQTDYLDEDPVLRGQNFVCLSFLSPEDVIKKKEVFFFESFLKNFSLDLNEFFDRLGERYPDDKDALRSIQEKYQFLFNPNVLHEEYLYYINNHSQNLEKDYLEKNNFQTSIRGLKVRGVFDTMKEAEIRAQVLKKVDNRFNVYVAQVGCWVPFNPSPDDIENQEYAETHLNTLMKNYKENQEKKDLFYEERKRDLQVFNMKKKLEEKDAWSQRKEVESAAGASTSGTVVDESAAASVGVASEEVPEVAEVPTVPEVPEVPAVVSP